MRWWHDAGDATGTGARVAYVETERSWIAVGSPLAEPDETPRAIRRFADAARACGRRPVFFGVERIAPFDGYRRLVLGLQSVLRPSEWRPTLRRLPRLREQLRRARAKRVRVRVVAPSELADGTPLRRAVDGLREEWLASRRMEPMGFLVSVELFHAPDEHIYIVAERDGVAVQFLSAVPVYRERGWLVEDMLRAARAPNGTTELMLDCLMQAAAGDAVWITPGLTPLAGRMPWWLRAARVAMAPLYDFAGLERFRARLSPSQWNPVWMAWDRGAAPIVLLDVLRAFAGGRLLPFARRSLVRHPGGPPWAVALPLVCWTLLLVALLAAGRSAWLGFSAAALSGWIAFDAVVAWLLFRAARKPRLKRLAIAAACVGGDLILSLRHLAGTGLGPDVASVLLRGIATGGPLLGSIALSWAMWRARVLATRLSH